MNILLKKHTLNLLNNGKSLKEITSKVQDLVTSSGVLDGICLLFIKHTSASLIIQENADKTVLNDLEEFMNRLIPEKNIYTHNFEGTDDMPSHIRSVLTQVSVNIPITNKKLELGTWQGIFIWEHRKISRRREIIVNIFGNM